MRRIVCILSALLVALAAPVWAGEVEHAYPEARSYDPALDASAAVDAALVRAGERGTLVLLVMGANWCHDSRALAGWLATPRFAGLLAEYYELVFVDAGEPQAGKGENLHIARRFGIGDLPGTPNVFVIAPDGMLRNADTVTGWRNAASRSEDAIFKELARHAAQK